MNYFTSGKIHINYGHCIEYKERLTLKFVLEGNEVPHNSMKNNIKDKMKELKETSNSTTVKLNKIVS